MGTRDVVVPKLEEPVIMWCYDTRGRGELGLSTQRDQRPAAWAAGSVSLLRGPASTMDAQNDPGAAAEKAQCVGTSLHEDPVSPTAALSHFPRKTKCDSGFVARGHLSHMCPRSLPGVLGTSCLVSACEKTHTSTMSESWRGDATSPLPRPESGSTRAAQQAPKHQGPGGSRRRAAWQGGACCSVGSTGPRAEVLRLCWSAGAP